jgi:hypothetical protein
MVENEKRRKYIMPALHSHTHCQSAQAKATTLAWQRVCLSNRTTKTADKQADEKEHRSDNSGFAKKRVQWLIQHSTSHQILCYVDSFELRNPLLRKAAKHLNLQA